MTTTLARHMAARAQMKTVKASIKPKYEKHDYTLLMKAQSLKTIQPNNYSIGRLIWKRNLRDRSGTGKIEIKYSFNSNL
jgi:hypothetical protein